MTHTSLEEALADAISYVEEKVNDTFKAGHFDLAESYQAELERFRLALSSPTPTPPDTTNEEGAGE